MKTGVKTFLHSILSLVLGLLVFVVFSHMRPYFTQTADQLGRVVLLALLLTFSVLAWRSSRFRGEGNLLYAYFIALIAMSIDYYLESSKVILTLLQIQPLTAAGLAVDKLDSCIILCVTIVVLSRLNGDDAHALFLKKGSFSKSLLIGLGAFVFCAIGCVFMSNQLGIKDLTLTKLLDWLPWILIFVLANALSEELLFRGLFLRKLEPLLGRFLSNAVITVPFVLHHVGVNYTSDVGTLLLMLIPLSLLWGYLTQKTDSIWGSVLFHAGTDLVIILTLFSRL